MTDINKTTHMQLKKKRVKKNPYKLGFNWFFWVSFFVILIPVCYFIYLLWMASQETHTPILGDRIKHTIQFAIDEDQLRIIEKDVNELPGVENAKVNLIVETVRIDVNTDDALKEDDLLKINQDIYGIVNEVLPVDKYFSQHDAQCAIVHIRSVQTEVAIAHQYLVDVRQLVEVVVNSLDNHHGLAPAIDSQGHVLYTLCSHFYLRQFANLCEYGVVGSYRFSLGRHHL